MPTALAGFTNEWREATQMSARKLSFQIGASRHNTTIRSIQLAFICQVELIQIKCNPRVIKVWSLVGQKMVW